MKKSILALFLLTLASQGTWCAADRSIKIEAAHQKTHLQVQELYETEGKKLLQVQSSGKLGHGQILKHHELNAIENHPRRMTIGHKGGNMGGGSGGGTNVGGGGGAASETRSHTTKKGGAPALPVPMTFMLTLVFTSAIVLSAYSF